MSAPNQPLPPAQVTQRQAAQFFQETILYPDGRVETKWAAAWQWQTTDARYLPPAAALSLAQSLSGVQPAGLAQRVTNAHQIPWAPGAPVPPQLALPTSRPGFIRRLLGGPGR